MPKKHKPNGDARFMLISILTIAFSAVVLYGKVFNALLFMKILSIIVFGIVVTYLVMNYLPKIKLW